MRQKPLLTIVVPELLPVPPTLGGAVEQWVHETTQRMDPQSFDIRICSRPTEQSSPHGIRNLHVRWTMVERWCEALKQRLSWRNPMRYVAKIIGVSAYGVRAMRMARDSDIVCIHNEPNLLLFLNKQPGQRVVLHMHNDHLTHPAFRWLYRSQLNKVDTVICVSDYIRQCAVRHFPEHAHRFEVLVNATAPDVFRPYGHEARQALADVLPPDDGRPLLLYVGRLVPEKGVDVLIRAFAELKQRQPSARLVIAGASFFAGSIQSPFQAELIRLAQPFKDDIIFTGYLPHAQLKYLYAVADVIAFPPVWGEPCGLVMLESMASGVCLVATSVGGIPEVMEHQRTGLLVPAGDSHALADALDQALSSATLRETFGQAAREKILAGYTWAHLLQRLPALLKGHP
jgi:spore coat protein SA